MTDSAEPRPGLWARIRNTPITDDGCRLEVRAGALLLVAACFLWQFAGPTWCVWGALVGLLLLAIGVPVQAFQARGGQPGYPWKLGLLLALFGGLQWFDLRYAETPGGPVLPAQTAVLMTVPGVWILLWGLVARRRSPA
jgi:hypothetical protein